MSGNRFQYDLKVLRCCDYTVQRHPHQFEDADFMALFRWDTSKHENFKTRMLGNSFVFILEKIKKSKDILLKRKRP